MLLVSNWKAYVESTASAKALFEVAKKLTTKKKHTIVLVPAAPHLAFLSQGNRSKVAFGAQNISDGQGGAATGEITAATIKGSGAAYVIIGHSEVRAKGDTNEIVAAKIQQALTHRLLPIVCVGERERDVNAEYLQELRHQIAPIYSPLSQEERRTIILAYEPVWAIGPTATGAITTEDLEEMVLYIRKVISDFIPDGAHEDTCILYGGSVDAENVHALTATTGVSGVLIGRASTEVGSYTALVGAL